MICSTTLDETEWIIKPQAHSLYLENSSDQKEFAEHFTVVGDKKGYFNIDFYPLTRNIEDLNFENEIQRLYFSSTSTQFKGNGIITLNCSKDTLDAKLHKNDYVVKLKGSYIFSQDRNNVYMTVRADPINNKEVMFSVLDLKKIEVNKEQSTIKNLLRLPSTVVNSNSVVLKSKIKSPHTVKLQSQSYSKRFNKDGLILSKALISKRLEETYRDPSDMKFFIEDEIWYGTLSNFKPFIKLYRSRRTPL